MNVMEKRYRLVTIREDIAHVESKLAALENTGVPAPDADRLRSASWHLERAIRILESVSLTGNAMDLAKILEASIGGIRARRRCEFIGAENNNAG